MPHIKKIREMEPVNRKSIMTVVLVDSGRETVAVGGMSLKNEKIKLENMSEIEILCFPSSYELSG